MPFKFTINDISLKKEDIIKIIDLIYKKQLNKNKKIKGIVTLLQKNFWLLDDFNLIEKNMLEKIYLLFVDFGAIKTIRFLGVLYWQRKDYEKSFKMYEKSFENGEIESAFDIGEFYYIGHYVKQNFDTALFYFTQYFDKFSNVSKSSALNNIEHILINHKYKISEEWKINYYNFISQQSERKNIEEIATLINFRLAKCLYRGIGTQKDFDGALSIIHKLSQKGYQPAKNFKSSFNKKYLQQFYLKHTQNILEKYSEHISNEDYLDLCNTNKYFFESL